MGCLRRTYIELLVVARALLASSLELLAHLADLLVDLGVLCGRHFDVSVAAGQNMGLDCKAVDVLTVVLLLCLEDSYWRTCFGEGWRGVREQVERSVGGARVAGAHDVGFP